MVHWGYGTAWGDVRGVLALAGLPDARATAVHLGLVWGSEQVMLPALEVAPPLTQWGAKEIAVDPLHHLVYATAYSLLDR